MGDLSHNPPPARHPERQVPLQLRDTLCGDLRTNRTTTPACVPDANTSQANENGGPSSLFVFTIRLVYSVHMTDRLPNEPRKPDDKEDEKEPAPTAGDFNVVLGPPPHGSIGSGNVYIRDADAHGNVIHNSPESEAYGFGARASRGGKAFGAFANADGEPELLTLLQQIVAALQEAGNDRGRRSGYPAHGRGAVLQA